MKVSLCVAPEITPFLESFFRNATPLCLKQLKQAVLMRRHVSMPTKFLYLNSPLSSIKFLKGISESLFMALVKSVNFSIDHIPEANTQFKEAC